MPVVGSGAVRDNGARGWRAGGREAEEERRRAVCAIWFDTSSNSLELYFHDSLEDSFESLYQDIYQCCSQLVHTSFLQSLVCVLDDINRR